MPRITTVLLDADGVVQRTSPRFGEILRSCVDGSGGEAEILADIFEAERPALTGRGDFRADLEVVLARWGPPSRWTRR